MTTLTVYVLCFSIIVTLLIGYKLYRKRRSHTRLPPAQLLSVMEFLPRLDVDTCEVTSHLFRELIRRNWTRFKAIKRVFSEIRLVSALTDFSVYEQLPFPGKPLPH